MLPGKWEFLSVISILYDRNPNKCKLLEKMYVASKFIMRFQIVW